MLLQVAVVPVCRFEMINSNAYIKETFGTAFFINSAGIFITAAHVIEKSRQSVQIKGGIIGLNVKYNKSGNFENGLICIKYIENAVRPYDIAIGEVDYKCETTFSLNNIGVEVWHDVMTYGYPATTLVNKSGSLRINLRAHKGYIQRLIATDDDVMSQNGQNHPESFETNFLISHGLSGSPLFLPANPRNSVIGVCVGNVSSEYNGVIEEVGIVQDIRPLMSWCPSFLNGKTLAEISI